MLDALRYIPNPANDIRTTPRGLPLGKLANRSARPRKGAQLLLFYQLPNSAPCTPSCWLTSASGKHGSSTARRRQDCCDQLCCLLRCCITWYASPRMVDNHLSTCLSLTPLGHAACMPQTIADSVPAHCDAQRWTVGPATNPPTLTCRTGCRWVPTTSSQRWACRPAGSS